MGGNVFSTVKPRQRIGILGGSFNPIHNGHVALAQWLVAKSVVDEVWLMVSPQNPLKPQSELLHEAIRLEMAQAAVAGVVGVRASDFEFMLPRPSYTWHTLQQLSAAYPESDFYLIIGSDNWAIFNQWFHASDILNHYHVVVYPREGRIPVANRISSNGHVIYVKAPLYPMSSTLIRHRLQSGDDCRDFLPKAVHDIICQRGYYIHPNSGVHTSHETQRF